MSANPDEITTNEQAREYMRRRISDAAASGHAGPNARVGAMTLGEFDDALGAGAYRPRGEGEGYVTPIRPDVTPDAPAVAQPPVKRKPTPLPDRIVVKQDGARSTLVLEMPEGKREYSVYDVPVMQADELLFHSARINELRGKLGEAKTIEDVRGLRDQMAGHLIAQMQMVIPDLKPETVFKLNRRSYDAVMDTVKRIGEETLGLYDLTETDENAPKGEGGA